jgi:class 3 adenylate cyclase
MRAIVTGMAGQPSGTVTILFSDIEGSTRLLQQLGAEQYAEALELLSRRLRGRWENNRVQSPGRTL